MIRRNFLLVISCLLISNSVYGATEVKPPEGPFISQLRVTFSVVKNVVLNVRDTIVKEKKYNFPVPDLGRYQERSPATVMIEKPLINPSVFTDDNASTNTDRAFKPVFDSSAFALSAPQNNQQQSSPFSVPNQSLGQQAPKKMSFDAMPISSNTASHLINSYPAEWSQLNPLNIVQGQGLEKKQYNNFVMPNNSQNNLNQNSHSIGQPFSNPRLQQPMNNNSNYGYK